MAGPRDGDADGPGDRQVAGHKSGLMGPRLVLHLFFLQGRAPPPPLLQTKVTIVGKNELYFWETLVGPFLVREFLGRRPPPPI